MATSAAIEAISFQRTQQPCGLAQDNAVLVKQIKGTQKLWVGALGTLVSVVFSIQWLLLPGFL